MRSGTKSAEGELFSSDFKAASTCFVETSSSNTGNPALAICPAICDPIVPEPRTATLRIMIVLQFEYREGVAQASARAYSLSQMLMTIFFAIFAAAFGLSSAPQTPPTVKLYVFDCGTLKSGNPDVLLARGVTTTDMSVT